MWCWLGGCGDGLSGPWSHFPCSASFPSLQGQGRFSLLPRGGSLAPQVSRFTRVARNGVRVPIDLSKTESSLYWSRLRNSPGGVSPVKANFWKSHESTVKSQMWPPLEGVSCVWKGFQGPFCQASWELVILKQREKVMIPFWWTHTFNRSVQIAREQTLSIS